MSSISENDPPNITIPALQKLVAEGKRLVMTTAYDALSASLADTVADLILVGDSVGNVLLGFENADSDVKPAGIPINIRPPFRFEAGHDSNQLPAGFRH